MTAAPTAAGALVRPIEFKCPSGDVLTVLVDDSRDALLTDFGKATLRDRYLLPGESYQDLFARVAIANSDQVVRGEVDDVVNHHAQRLYDYISKLWFMPATPVLTNSGVPRGLPISCFLNLVGDSMESIAEAVTENTWLSAKGGGIGTCWSPLRSIGEAITLAGPTSGIIPFIKWQDAQTLAISQGALRRGSAAAYLDLSHPEIEEFIDIRRPSGGDPRRKAHNIHHGVTVPDAFMQKAFQDDAADRAWDLVSPKTGAVIKTVDARELLIKLLVARLETGEPYIIFSDAVSRNLPAIYQVLGLSVKQSNLCSEITLHTGEDYAGKWRTAVCCLSSVNFDTVEDWMGDATFLKDVMRFLDNVLTLFIERSKTYPGFDRARYSAEMERSVGLGMMGFHSYLQSVDLPYESKQAQTINKAVWSWLKETADDLNVGLANERGECPDSAAAGGRDATVLPKRLTHVFSVAPTASISIIAGGASPAGEPAPANSFTQKTLSGSYNVRNKHLDVQLRRRYWQLKESLQAMNKTVRALLREQPMFRGMDLGKGKEGEDLWVEDQWQSITINDGSVQHLPYLCPQEKATFKTAFEMDQRWVVRHAADRTPFVCQAQSVNLFLPANVHKKDLVEVHKLAWEVGLKSLYYVRSRTVSKAMAVSHMAGDMPNAQIEEGQPIYIDEPECLACQ